MVEKSASEIKDILQNEPISPDNSQSAEELYLVDQLDKEIKLAYLNTLKQNNTERKKYARHIFFFTCAWAITIVIIIFCDGLNNFFHLSDSVLITLITTTTINFFGFFLLVTKYLFNAKAIEKANPFSNK